MRILIVESIGTYVRMLRTRLVTVLEARNNPGCTIDVAYSAVDARQMLYEREPYDLIITAADLPDEQGISLVRKIREAWTGGWLPIIMVSDSGRRRDVLIALANGVDDYVLKPFKEGRFEHRAGLMIDELIRQGKG